ncbi:MAG: response regulator [Gemmatimonadaceae bacterium]|nr:response regulator [Gemmatimonadaceae bacterium]
MILRLAAFAVLLIGTTSSGARAQSVPGQIDDAAYVGYGRRDGLPDAPILSLRMERSGYVVAGTSQGVFRFNGRSWESESLPPMVSRREYRDVLEAPDGRRFYVHSFGVVLREGTRWTRVDSLATRLAPIYSATIWRDEQGQATLVVGASGGVFRWSPGSGFVAVPLPDGMSSADAMVDAAPGAAGRGDALWIGTRGGGVARLLQGRWTHWGEADGLTSLGIEHIAAAPAQDSVRAIVATQAGAFVLDGARWRPVGPRQHLARALRVVIDGRGESWLGALSGELYRVVDGAPFSLIELSGRTRGSRAQVLRAVSHDPGRTTIYAGFRSGSLLRFQLGGAGRLIVPPEWIGHPVTAVASKRGPGEPGFWSWMLGVGAVRVPDLRTIGAGTVFLEGGDGRVRLLPTRAGGERLLLSVEWRLFQHRNGVWQRLGGLGPGDYIHGLVELPTPDGPTRPVIIGTRGAWILSDRDELVPWEGFPLDIVTTEVDTAGTTDSTRHVSVLAVSRQGLVYRLDSAGWRALDVPPRPRQSFVRAAATLRLPSGEHVVVLGTGDGVEALCFAGGTKRWKRLDADGLWTMAGREILDLAALPDGRLAVGTGDGLQILDMGTSLDEPERIVSSFTDADGLPHPFVSSIGGVDAEQRLWVGTTLGVGVVPLAAMRTERAPPRLLGVSVLDGAGRPIEQDARIDADNARLDVTVYATSYHRDLDLRYRVELDGIPLHRVPWTDRATHTQLSLPAGQHVLRVQVMDFEGRRSAMLERRFRVLTPPWRSPAAVLAYGVLFIGTWIGVLSWRTRSVQHRAQEAEANERRLSISEERFRRLFEDGVNPQLLVLDGVVWKANAAAQQLLGQDLPLAGTRVELLLPVTDGMPMGAGNTPVPDSWRRELVGRTTQGEPLPLDVRRTRIPLDEGTLEHLELQDLRERERLARERRDLEAHVRETQRLESVGTLAGGVAHDFNNLLTVIQSNAELAVHEVQQAPAPVPAAADALRQVLVASRRAREVVRQILTFSRKTPPRRSDIHVRTLLEETLTLLRATIPSTITLTVNDRAGEAWVKGDATQLQQVLLNLCANAEHAMRATHGGVLTITLDWASADRQLADGQATLLLSVRDTGTGMTDDVRARAFEPFYTTKPVGEGTGLGLSVLHGIVGAHGGDVALQSVPGAGTSVTVRLPAFRREAKPAHLHTPAATDRVRAPRRVLVVDDEPAIAQVLQRTLTRRGFEVETASNGAEALSRLGRGPDIDVLVTDHTMPVMTGAELITRLRESGNACPVVLMSGFGAVISDEHLAPYADVQRLDKPFATEDLVRLIAGTT